MMKGNNRVGWHGASTSRGPGPAQSGAPEDDDPEKVRLRKDIRKALEKLLKKYCLRYCSGMGFCGKYCSRGRTNFHFLGAAEARSLYAYQHSELDPLFEHIARLKRLGVITFPLDIRAKVKT
ncbi:unnamed protein product, partial [Dovyalis caffra]